MNSKKKEETQLIISLSEDNSSIYSYDQRVLDALASIFNIQSTCAAIALHTATNKFLLSYNEKCTGVTEKKLQDLLTLIKKSLQAEHQSKEAKCQLVALYIIFNGEFYPRIRDFGEQEDLKEDTFNLLNLLSTEIEQAKKDLNTYCYNLEMLQQEFKQKTALLPKANTIEEIELIQNKLHAECEEFKHNIEHKESKLNQVFNKYKALFKNLKKYSAPNLQ